MDCFCPHVVEITIFPSLLLEGGAISYDCCFKSQTVTRFEGQHCIRIVSRIAFGLNLHFCHGFSQRNKCWKHLAIPSLYLLLKTVVNHGLPHSFPLKLPLLTGILTKVSCQVPVFTDKYPMIFPFTGKLGYVWLYVLYIPIHGSHSQNPHIHVDYSAVNEHSYGNDHL